MQKAVKSEAAAFDAGAWRLGVVVAQFNASITEQLLTSAVQRAADYGLSPDRITVVKVAGAVEIPLVLQQLARSGQYQALLAIGCVIRGATPHFDYVCRAVTDGVMRVQLDHQQPIGFGVLTCNTEAEAQARAHLGGEHLDAVLQQVRSLRELA